MARAKTPSFIAEFPLRTTAADEKACAIRLDAGRHIYNACLGEALRRLRLIRQSKAWQAARALPKGKDRTAAFKAINTEFDFNSGSIQKYAEGCRDSCWLGDHISSHDTQTTSLRAFRAVQMYALKVRGRPRFKGKNKFSSIEGKMDAVIRFRHEPIPAVYWSGLVLPLVLDPNDEHEWEKRALEARTKYVRVIRRNVRGRDRWYCQLIQGGVAPQVRETNEGVVGLDIGPSTIAAVSDTAAIHERFCPSVVQPWAECRRLERAMDRSRRATNPDNFDEKERPKKGKKPWNRSIRYQRLAMRGREHERKLAAERKRAHGELANRVLGQGTTIKTEKLSYKAWQKTFGRSSKLRAAGSFVSLLRRKAASAGGGVIEIKTRHTKLSQFDHTTETYVKKPLKQRIHVFGDGTEPVQRDLYSAFLARCCDSDTLDIGQVHATWPSAELLLRAVSGFDQPASGKGFARPHVVSGVRVGRPQKEAGRSGEAVDDVAKARATKRQTKRTSRSLCLQAEV